MVRLLQHGIEKLNNGRARSLSNLHDLYCNCNKCGKSTLRRGVPCRLLVIRGAYGVHSFMPLDGRVPLWRSGVRARLPTFVYGVSCHVTSRTVASQTVPPTPRYLSPMAAVAWKPILEYALERVLPLGWQCASWTTGSASTLRFGYAAKTMLQGDRLLLHDRAGV